MRGLRLVHEIGLATYFSLIILIGLPFLLSLSELEAILIALATFAVYLGCIRLFRVVLRRFHGGPLQESTAYNLLTSLTIVAGMNVMFVALSGQRLGVAVLPARFYFYAVFLYVLTMVGVFFYDSLWRPYKPSSIEFVKAEIQFWIEITRGAITGFLVALFGAAFTQVLTGFLPDIEMLLILLTIVGGMFVIGVPIAYTLWIRIFSLRRLEAKQLPAFLNPSGGEESGT